MLVLDTGISLDNRRLPRHSPLTLAKILPSLSCPKLAGLVNVTAAAFIRGARRRQAEMAHLFCILHNAAYSRNIGVTLFVGKLEKWAGRDRIIL